MIKNCITIITAFLWVQISIANTPNAKVIIYPEDRYGKVLEYLIFDLKYSMGDINSAAKANRFFNEYDMNGVRISVYGNEGNRYHPAAGTVLYDASAKSGYYKLVNSVKLAQTSRKDKDFVVFASKKLKNVVSWPDWVLDNGGPKILTDEYVTLLYDYFTLMKSHGIEIDILGIDNEERFNKAEITPAQYKDIIEKLKLRLDTLGYKIPLWMGYEDYDPNLRAWVSTLMNNGWKDYMDIYGVHYYPNTRKLTALKADLSKIEDIPFWSTEAHWSSKANQDELVTAEIGMTALWDQTDIGLDGLCMWDFRKSETDLRFNLLKEAMLPLKDAQPIFTDDSDGISIAAAYYGKQLFTRSFIEDSLVTVYAINMTNNAFTSQAFEINTGLIENNVSYVQFTDNSPITGNKGTAQKHSNNREFELNLPSRSVTQFSFIIAPNNIVKLECEDLSYHSPTSTTTVQNNALAAGGKHINLAASGSGKSILFGVDASEGGSYDLTLSGLSWTTMGKYKCEVSTDNINWQQFDTSLDFYSTQSSRTNITWKGVQLKAGSNAVRFTSVDKNEKSSSYKGSFDYLLLQKSTQTSVKHIKSISDISVSPNPASGTLKVHGVLANTPITIYSITGVQLIQTHTQQININHLPKGQYILKANGKVKMFIKH